MKLNSLIPKFTIIKFKPRVAKWDEKYYAAQNRTFELGKLHMEEWSLS